MQSIPKISLAVASLGLAMLFTSTPCLRAQTSMAPAAPLPSQILTAKKVFIPNSGGGFDPVSWTGGPDRIYNELVGDDMNLCLPLAMPIWFSRLT
jgi:hypothetical protein